MHSLSSVSSLLLLWHGKIQQLGVLYSDVVQEITGRVTAREAVAVAAAAVVASTKSAAITATSLDT